MKVGAILLCVTLLAAASWCSAQTVSSENTDAHQQLQRIMQDPMYQAWRLRQEGHIPTLDDRGLMQKLGDLLKPLADKFGDFIDWLFRSGRYSSNRAAQAGSGLLPVFLKSLAWAAVALAVVFIVGLIIKMMKTPTGTALTANVLSRQQIQSALESGDALALGTAQWLNEAQRLAAEQNFRAVYRALYLALLSGLHSAGKIEHNKNRTNWTYVQYYRGPAEERVTFSELTELFDRVWYGHKDAGNRNIDNLRLTISTLTGAGSQP